MPLLKKAFSRFEREEYIAAHRAEAQNFAAFLKEGEYYDFALFMSLKTHFSYRPWQEWGEYAQFGEEKAEKSPRNTRKKSASGSLRNTNF